MTKCNICGKLIWFWQTPVYKEVAGNRMPPELIKSAHWKCALKILLHIRDCRCNAENSI